jgi:hypothetical protein
MLSMGRSHQPTRSPRVYLMSHCPVLPLPSTLGRGLKLFPPHFAGNVLGRLSSFSLSTPSLLHHLLWGWTLAGARQLLVCLFLQDWGQLPWHGSQVPSTVPPARPRAGKGQGQQQPPWRQECCCSHFKLSALPSTSAPLPHLPPECSLNKDSIFHPEGQSQIHSWHVLQTSLTCQRPVMGQEKQVAFKGED